MSLESTDKPIEKDHRLQKNKKRGLQRSRNSLGIQDVMPLMFLEHMERKLLLIQGMVKGVYSYEMTCTMEQDNSQEKSSEYKRVEDRKKKKEKNI
jgi:hypothetical protein